MEGWLFFLNFFYKKNQNPYCTDRVAVIENRSNEFFLKNGIKN